MTLDELEKEWIKDSKISETNLAAEALKIPSLHQKWYSLMVKEKFAVEKVKIQLQEREVILDHYFQRMLTLEELERNKLPPYSEKRIAKADIPHYIKLDTEVVKMKMKIMLGNEKAEYMKDIIKSLHGRGFLIRDAIEFIKFQNGG